MVQVRVVIFRLIWLFGVGSMCSSVSGAKIRCGIPKSTVNRVIVRGSEADPKHWPWHCALFHVSNQDDRPEYQCGGVLIHQKYIITAKHCVMDSDNDHLLAEEVLLVQLGVKRLYRCSLSIQEHRVQNIHVVSDKAKAKLRNDIAILEMLTAVRFNDYVRPACLIQREVSTRENGTAIGFGLTQQNKLSSVLRQAEMPVVNPLRCVRDQNHALALSLDEGYFCVGLQNGTTVCNGDSGGGFYVREDGIWKLAGIIAFTLPRDEVSNLCRLDSYSALTNVFEYLEWIRNITGVTAIHPKEHLLPRDCGRGTEKDYRAWVYREDEWSWNRAGVGMIISKRYLISIDNLGSTQRHRVVLGLLGEPTVRRIKDFERYTYRNVVAINKRFIERTGLFIYLLRLDNATTFKDGIQPLCLPLSEELRAIQPERVTLFDDDGGVLSGTGVHFSNCSREFQRKASNREMCIKTLRCDRKRFISFFQNDSKAVLSGFVIEWHGSSCLYLINKIANHVDWILETIEP